MHDRLIIIIHTEDGTARAAYRNINIHRQHMLGNHSDKTTVWRGIRVVSGGGPCRWTLFYLFKRLCPVPSSAFVVSAGSSVTA